jgi:hypothetical protein
MFNIIDPRITRKGFDNYCDRCGYTDSPLRQIDGVLFTPGFLCLDCIATYQEQAQCDFEALQYSNLEQARVNALARIEVEESFPGC